MALEGLVRPFETRSRFNNNRIPTKNIDPVGGASHLCWGDVGTLPTPRPAGINVEMNDCNEGQKEIQGREATDMRIENPDDPDQFVMVRRPKTIVFNHSEKKQSTWDQMSLVAASVDAWQQDLEADLGVMGDETKCKLKMTLKPPDEDPAAV